MDGMILMNKLAGFGKMNVDELLHKLSILCNGGYAYITPLERQILDVITREVF